MVRDGIRPSGSLERGTVDEAGTPDASARGGCQRMHETKWVIFIFLLFSIIYSIISYLRYISFSENVLDLGVSASLAYNVVYGATFFSQILHGGVAVNKLIYIPIGLIYSIYPKEYFLLFIQDFFLAFSGVVLYFLSYEFTKSKKISTVVSLLFFLYFPIAGVFWPDIAWRGRSK